jgi:hypothetical protein
MSPCRLGVHAKTMPPETPPPPPPLLLLPPPLLLLPLFAAVPPEDWLRILAVDEGGVPADDVE